MAVGLRFTDGTTTITLSNGTTGTLIEYVQGSAPADVDKVTDRATVLLLGGISTIRSTIEDLNRLFWMANQRQKNPGWWAHVYVERDPGTGTFYRSEIISAVPIHTAQTLDEGIEQGKIEIQLSFTRYNYWEGAEVELSLTNTAGSGTGGRNIYNHDDADAFHDNYVYFTNPDAGDVPYPLKITLRNGNGSVSPKFIWIGMAYGKAAIACMLEAESATGKSGTLDATCSNGKREDVSLTGGSEATLLYWTITPAYYTPNLFWKVIMRMADTTNMTTTRFRLQLLKGSTVVWQSQQMQPKTASEYTEIGTVRIPPYILDSYSNLEPAILRLTGQNASTVTLKFDFLGLMPTTGWRVFKFHPAEILLNLDTILDDGIDRQTLVMSNTGTDKRRYLVPFGDYIMVEPGMVMGQVLVSILVFTDYGGTATVDYYQTIRIYYRPRWLTI